MNDGGAQNYVLDANVFMEAHRRYYAFDLCPGFWECMLHHHAETRLVSIDRVRNEIYVGDELEKWVKKTAPSALFASTQAAAIATQFGAIMAWVQGNSQYKPEAKAEFAQVADGWLAAYAKVHGHILVTQEEFAPDAKKRVPLPNVCKQFAVEYVDTFAMLRDLRASFFWDS